MTEERSSPGHRDAVRGPDPIRVLLRCTATVWSTMIWSEAKMRAREVPDQDHRDVGWKSCGGSPVSMTASLTPLDSTVKSTPLAVRLIVPGTTRPSRRNVVVPRTVRVSTAWLTVSK